MNTIFCFLNQFNWPCIYIYWETKVQYQTRFFRYHVSSYDAVRNPCIHFSVPLQMHYYQIFYVFLEYLSHLTGWSELYCTSKKRTNNENMFLRIVCTAASWWVFFLLPVFHLVPEVSITNACRRFLLINI